MPVVKKEFDARADGPLIDAEARVYYADHAYEFVMDQIVCPARHVLGDIEPTKHQKYILDAAPHEPRIAVESGHGSGKSVTLAWLGMWYLVTRMNRLGHLVKVPVLAPTFHQLHDVVWIEFKRWIPISRLNGILGSNNFEVWVKGMKDSVWARARSPQVPGHIQGNHATHLMWLIDEAFGITDDLTWETIEGSLTEEDNRIIMGGQHTTITGYVHNAFNKDRDQWHTGRFNSEESPLVKQAYCQRIAGRYGRASDIYRVRVLGMAPKGNPDAFIQLEDVEKAKVREVKGTGRLYMGVDPARFGDDSTVVTLRHGNHVFPQRALPYSDTDDIVKLTLDFLKWGRKETGVNSKCQVMIGSSGGWGAGTIDALNKDTANNIEVIPVSEAGPGNDEYADAVSVMWSEGRDMLSEMDLPQSDEDDALTEELATRRYKYVKGRIQIEPKAIFKKEYGASPDHADSFLLSCTRRAPEVRVWNSYMSTSADHHRNYPIAWELLESGKFRVYVTLTYEKATGIYASFFFWGRESRKLYIFDEYCDINPVASVLADEVKRRAVIPLTGSRPVKVDHIYGSKEMFGKGDTLQKLLRRVKIIITRNPRYEEAGAIALVNQLFARNQIVVHSRCEETDRQVRSWVVRKNRPDPGHPLCRGLCVVASVLRAHRELSTSMPMKPYGKQKQRLRKVLKQTKNSETPRTRKTGYEYYAR